MGANMRAIRPRYSDFYLQSADVAQKAPKNSVSKPYLDTAGTPSASKFFMDTEIFAAPTATTTTVPPRTYCWRLNQHLYLAIENDVFSPAYVRLEGRVLVFYLCYVAREEKR